MSLNRGCFLLNAFLLLLVAHRSAGLSAAEASEETNAGHPVPKEITGRVYIDGQDAPPDKRMMLLFVGEKEEDSDTPYIYEEVEIPEDGKFNYTIPKDSPALKSAYFITRNVSGALYDDDYLGQTIYFGYGNVGPDGKVAIALERAVPELAEVEVRDAGGKRLPRAKVRLSARAASAKDVETSPRIYISGITMDTDPDGLLRIGVVRSPKIEYGAWVVSAIGEDGRKHERFDGRLSPRSIVPLDFSAYKPNEPIGPLPVTFKAEKITEPFLTAELNFSSREMKEAYLFSKDPYNLRLYPKQHANGGCLIGEHLLLPEASLKEKVFYYHSKSRLKDILDYHGPKFTFVLKGPEKGDGKPLRLESNEVDNEVDLERIMRTTVQLTVVQSQ